MVHARSHQVLVCLQSLFGWETTKEYWGHDAGAKNGKLPQVSLALENPMESPEVGCDLVAKQNKAAPGM